MGIFNNMQNIIYTKVKLGVKIMSELVNLFFTHNFSLKVSNEQLKTSFVR